MSGEVVRADKATVIGTSCAVCGVWMPFPPGLVDPSLVPHLPSCICNKCVARVGRVPSEPLLNFASLSPSASPVRRVIVEAHARKVGR